jgi:hypothetical protein
LNRELNWEGYCIDINGWIDINRKLEGKIDSVTEEERVNNVVHSMDCTLLSIFGNPHHNINLIFNASSLGGLVQNYHLLDSIDK